jgi:hypothetical protein
LRRGAMTEKADLKDDVRDIKGQLRTPTARP